MSETGRHLSNIHDPSDQNAPVYLIYSFHAQDSGVDAMRQEWDRHMDWVNANVRGRPKGTDTYTVEQLEGMGMIGIYAKPDDEPK